jgi:hypothetical protein
MAKVFYQEQHYKLGLGDSVWKWTGAQCKATTGNAIPVWLKHLQTTFDQSSPVSMSSAQDALTWTKCEG